MRQKFFVGLKGGQFLLIQTSDHDNINDLVKDIYSQFELYFDIPEIKVFYIQFVQKAIIKKISVTELRLINNEDKNCKSPKCESILQEEQDAKNDFMRKHKS